MGAFFSFVLFVAWAVVFVRAGNFIRRAKARHRALLAEMGFKENNPAYRLRQDRATRVGYGSYAVIGGLLNIFFSALMPRGSGIASLPISIIGALPVAAIVWVLYRSYQEVNTPYTGLLFLLLRDNHHHRVMKPLPLKGEHGTAQEVTPDKGGFTINPIGWIAGGYQPIPTAQGAK